MPGPHAQPVDTEGAIRHARRLAEGLSGRLLYHGPHHTFEEVLPSAVALARDSGASAHQLDLVRAAAAFHDLGYLEGRHGHEAASVRIARRDLPRFGFAATDLDAIAGMILATRLPQSPTTTWEAVLADADVALVGSRDFLRRSDDLRLELAATAGRLSEASWYARQLRFLLQHRFHTPAARVRYGPGKLRNLARAAARHRAALQKNREARCRRWLARA